MCISCIKEEVSNHFLFFCVYIYYANYIIISFKHFNNSIKIKSIDQWEVWFGEQAPREGVTHLCRRSI